MVIHPPGYSILLLIIGERGLRPLQLVADSLCAVLVVLICARLFPLSLAAIAGLLVAVLPHFAYYSLWLTPETISALPLLIAAYLIASRIERPGVLTMAAAGASIGLSCWFRSNAILLSPFLALAILPIVGRGRRIRCFLSMIAATAVVILPITIRNWVAYHRFIPVSIGSGITLIEGIGDYDLGDRFQLPTTDKEVAAKDAEWHGRPDYARSIWVPDGVDRDRARFSRGLAAIRSDPFWFAGVMVRRAVSMLRYNDSIESKSIREYFASPIRGRRTSLWPFFRRGSRRRAG
jgi:hypothetical protein